MRAAGNAWEKDYAAKLEEAGFVRGVAAPTVFFHKSLNVRCVVQGDDFPFLGYDQELNFVEKLMNQRYDVKTRGRLGGGKG